MGKLVDLLDVPFPGFEASLKPEEVQAFFEQSTDRAMAIIWGAIVENHLTSLLKLLMRRDDKSMVADLFQPTGPLGPFGTKVKLAYMLRIIAKPMFHDLSIIVKIRNAFAHDLSTTSFEDQQITSWIKNMPTHSTIKKWVRTHLNESKTIKAWERLTLLLLASTTALGIYTRLRADSLSISLFITNIGSTRRRKR